MLRSVAVCLFASSAALFIGCANNTANHDISTKTAQNGSAPPAITTSANFGGELTLTESETISVTDVAAAPAAYDGKYVRLTGTVTNVCPHKGCWLEMADCEGNEDIVFVKFPDPETGKLIPTEAMGKPVIAEGVVRFREISETQAKHYAEEGGATPEQLAKLVGPQKQVILTTPRVRIAGVSN